MSKRIVSPLSSNVKSFSRHLTSSPRSSVSRANANLLMRIEQIKNKFVSAKLTGLRTHIYSTMRQAGASHLYALAEVDRAFREVAASIANVSKQATNAAAQAELLSAERLG